MWLCRLSASKNPHLFRIDSWELFQISFRRKTIFGCSTRFTTQCLQQQKHKQNQFKHNVSPMSEVIHCSLYLVDTDPVISRSTYGHVTPNCIARSHRGWRTQADRIWSIGGGCPEQRGFSVWKVSVPKRSKPSMLRYTLTKYIKLNLLRKTVSHIVELFPQIQKP